VRGLWHFLLWHIMKCNNDRLFHKQQQWVCPVTLIQYHATNQHQPHMESTQHPMAPPTLLDIMHADNSQAVRLSPTTIKWRCTSHHHAAAAMPNGPPFVKASSGYAASFIPALSPALITCTATSRLCCIRFQLLMPYVTISTDTSQARAIYKCSMPCIHVHNRCPQQSTSENQSKE